MTRFVIGLADTKASLSRCIRIYGTLVLWLLGLNITKQRVKQGVPNTIKIPQDVHYAVIVSDEYVTSINALNALDPFTTTKKSGSYEMTETSKSFAMNAMTTGKPKAINVSVSYDVTVFMSEDEWKSMTDSERLAYLQDIPMNAYTLSYDVG